MATRKPNGNDILRKLQALQQQVAYQSAINAGRVGAKKPMSMNNYSSMGSASASFGGYSHSFGRGSRIVLITGEGQYSGFEYNPKWGEGAEYIAGVVRDMSGDGIYVAIQWDNGRENMYDFNRGGIQIVALENAPKPKSKLFGKSIELDTTKLDKLVIDPEMKIEIVALLQQHKHAKKIFDDWGLAEVIEYGRGMTLMFWGLPGTGKTFGARCIAKALGKDLLVISAAEIQSSEPGGANRNIQQAFATAASENKVLFIDECDSLIANRANLGMILASEINTLLTEIEKSEQVVILATNRIEDMDSALERRISLIVEFPMPNEEQRRDIWKGLLPEKMPLGEDVKIEELAKHELSGGLIKNVVLQAARLALSDDADKVAKKHFDKAIHRTTSSTGLMGKERIQTKQDGMSVGVGGKTMGKRTKVETEKLREFLGKTS